MYTQSLFWAIGACVTTRALLHSSKKKKTVDLTDGPTKGMHDREERRVEGRVCLVGARVWSLPLSLQVYQQADDGGGRGFGRGAGERDGEE